MLWFLAQSQLQCDHEKANTQQSQAQNVQLQVFSLYVQSGAMFWSKNWKSSFDLLVMIVSKCLHLHCCEVHMQQSQSFPSTGRSTVGHQFKALVTPVNSFHSYKKKQKHCFFGDMQPKNSWQFTVWTWRLNVFVMVATVWTSFPHQNETLELDGFVTGPLARRQLQHYNLHRLPVRSVRSEVSNTASGFTLQRVAMATHIWISK